MAITEEATNTQRYVRPVGYWSSLFTTVLGITYCCLVIWMAVSGNFTLPPPEFVQTYAAIVDLLLCPALIILVTSIHYTVPTEKKIFSQLAIIFTTIFAVMVSINRFIQITVVRLGTIEGNLEGLSRFLPYDTRSVTFSLELLGFGLFLSIALVFLALALSSKGRQKTARYIFVLYSVLGFVSIIGYISNSLAVNVGFIAWGLILYIGTGLLAVSFKSGQQ